MINQVYRLVSPRQFEVAYKDRSLNSDRVVIRPTYLSICAADQRYYTGSRDQAVMAKKLPMALIHEGIGEVVYDPSNEFKVGTRVVMVPNTPIETDEIIGENYLRSSKFRSSGYDGYLQDYVFMQRDRLVVLDPEMNPNVMAFTELMTIAMHAITRFEKRAHVRREAFGVWGDGNLGFIAALMLKKLFKNAKVYVFGKTGYKLDHFSFVDEVFTINNIPEDIRIDHGFECVGGLGSESAINQMIDVIQPEGSMSILGVSENPIKVNTRMILEKGITVIGSSRSGAQDFQDTVDFLRTYPDVLGYLEALVSSVNSVRSIQDITQCFEQDLATSWGKTVMKWDM
ncbi:ribitol-5-phosphate dehydrogenase [Pullulanibacillus sp. KACC 23026]|uniref:ribitol-5-phosphate dehydrogenase n=1 Tax=Pullulanibacillus sp. KACC 23026 TaxID=3028315 RepID=UPI0023B0523F|nr:ribitol-5-phosphate dehydrogenase [Pullulanibacillus sp. KACC 23026]WEG13142.1 ribitol-5-phosphate dehydrogenase [Pullulanibacillus sp. KACC 23026]